MKSSIFRFHLITALLLSITAGILLYWNFLPDERLIEFDDTNINVQERHKSTGYNNDGWIHVGTVAHPDRFLCYAVNYGWPYAYRQNIKFRGGIERWQFKDGVANAGIALAILLFITVVSEAFIRISLWLKTGDA
jgi:hypothetical protein